MSTEVARFNRNNAGLVRVTEDRPMSQVARPARFYLPAPLESKRRALPLGRLTRLVGGSFPALAFGLRLWASVCLALYVVFWLELDNPFWAGTSAAIVCQPQLGASLRKGWFRMIGTLVGAVMSVVLVACFPQDRALFLGALALWGAACAFVATLLRNFASYAAALAGYTVAIIAGDLLGATGGVNADAAFLLAVTRASEICIGIVCAGVVLAGTDLGGAPRRLALTFANLSSDIMSRFAGTLLMAGPELPDTQPLRREFIRRVIALDPIIDQSLGESSRLRYHSPILQRAVDGLFIALAGWRAVADHLVMLAHDAVRQEAAVIMQGLPQELRSPYEHGEPARWIADPTGLHRICDAAMRRLIALPVATPSLRLLADKTAEVMAGMVHALSGLALLVADPARPVSRPGIVRLRVADWLPALVNAGRTFVVIGAVTLFWIVSIWPNGAGAITFAAIVVILLGPQADQAYAAAVFFTVGALLDVVLTAITAFAVLPALETETFAGFSLVIGLCLVPIGALLAQARQPWQTMFTAMAMLFVPLLEPTNPETYDTVQFYNSALAIVAGSSAAALSFRLLPPLSPAFRTRRLLALTLRDLRRLAMGRAPGDWEGHIYGRLSAMPDAATPLQRAQLMAALAVGSEIIRVRHITHRLGLGAELDPALAAVARRNSASAIAHLAHVDAALAARGGTGQLTQTVLRARGNILGLSQVLTQYANYFNGGATDAVHRN
jgi:uncharacterized membrane protein YccC